MSGKQQQQQRNKNSNKSKSAKKLAKKSQNKRQRNQKPRVTRYITGQGRNFPRPRANLNRKMQGYSKGIITDVMRKQPQLSNNRMFMNYLKCLTNNSMHEARYPDSNPRKTAIFTSVSSVDIPIIFDTAATSAKFSFAVQPIMGDITQPSHYQVAAANLASGLNTSPWEGADWSSANSYKSLQGGRDVRVDINSPYLIAGVTQGFSETTTFTPAGAALVQPATSAGAQNFFGNLAPANAVTVIDTAIGTLPVISAPQPAGTLLLPPGQYVATLNMFGTCSNAGGLANVRPIFFNPGGLGLTSTEIISNPCVAVANTINFNASSVWSLNVTVPTVMKATIVKTGGTGFLAAADLSALITHTTFSPTTIPAIQQPVNFGAMELVRPVAQTVLATYMGTSLQNGGRICSAYVNNGLLQTNYFTSAASSQIGQLQEVDNVASLSNAYDGELRNGTYCWWAPFEQSDIEFRTVAQMNASTWPAIVVSGNFNPNSASGVGNNDVLRCRICTTFEFQTKVTAFDSEVECGSQDLIDGVNHAVAQQPHCMPNGAHLGWLEGLIKGTGNAISKNSGSIASVIQGIGALAL